MSNLISTIVISGCCLVLCCAAAEATNLSTGEPCDLGIFDFRDRDEIFRQWIVPPTVVLIASAVVGLIAHRKMKQSEHSQQRRRRGIVAGISLAVFVAAVSFVGLIFFIDQFLPQWMY